MTSTTTTTITEPTIVNAHDDAPTLAERIAALPSFDTATREEVDNFMAYAESFGA